MIGFLAVAFGPGDRGHREPVAVVTSLASAIAIGSGAATDREGAIIQIGSAPGRTFGHIVSLPD